MVAVEEEESFLGEGARLSILDWCLATYRTGGIKSGKTGQDNHSPRQSVSFINTIESFILLHFFHTFERYGGQTKKIEESCNAKRSLYF